MSGTPGLATSFPFGRAKSFRFCDTSLLLGDVGRIGSLSPQLAHVGETTFRTESLLACPVFRAGLSQVMALGAGRPLRFRADARRTLAVAVGSHTRCAENALPILSRGSVVLHLFVRRAPCLQAGG